MFMDVICIPRACLIWQSLSKPATGKAVISDWTGIPVGKIVQDEAQILLDFEARLRKRIKGQDRVLGVVGNGEGGAVGTTHAT
jgi:hypothetical protein